MALQKNTLDEKKHCSRWMGRAIFSGCFLIGLIGGGYFIGNGIQDAFCKENRFITVDTFVRKEVRPTYALWDIYFQRTGSDLSDLEKKYKTDKEIIVSFLKNKGIPTKEIEIRSMTIRDQYTENSNMDTSKLPASVRYVMNSCISVCATDIKALQEAVKNADFLMEKGIQVCRNSDLNVEYSMNEMVMKLHKDANNNIFYYVRELTPELEKELYEESMEKASKAAQEIAAKSDLKIIGVESVEQTSRILNGIDEITKNVIAQQMMKVKYRVK